jgi:hypothetical protein
MHLLKMFTFLPLKKFNIHWILFRLLQLFIWLRFRIDKILYLSKLIFMSLINFILINFDFVPDYLSYLSNLHDLLIKRLKTFDAIWVREIGFTRGNLVLDLINVYVNICLDFGSNLIESWLEIIRNIFQLNNYFEGIFQFVDCID